MLATYMRPMRNKNLRLRLRAPLVAHSKSVMTFTMVLLLLTSGQLNKTFTRVAIVFRLLNHGYTCKLQV